MFRRQMGDPRRVSSPYLISLGLPLATLYLYKIAELALAKEWILLLLLFFVEEGDAYSKWDKEKWRRQREIFAALTTVAL